MTNCNVEISNCAKCKRKPRTDFFNFYRNILIKCDSCQLYGSGNPETVIKKWNDLMFRATSILQQQPAGGK